MDKKTIRNIQVTNRQTKERDFLLLYLKQHKIDYSLSKWFKTTSGKKQNISFVCTSAEYDIIMLKIKIIQLLTI